MKSAQDRMLDTTSPELPEDPRLMQAVQEYLQQLESGQIPDRQMLLDRYPDLAGPLAQCLDGLELVHKGTQRPVRPAFSPRKSGEGNATMTPATGDGVPANPLGDFQILHEIGRGGMGIVYQAVQLSLGRHVALKVLPFAATFDPKHLQRFHNEAHAAAQLHHTNIVPVYAVGCERGVHFYAMQLIEGQSLADVIQQLRQQAGRPDPDQSSPSRATHPARSVVQGEPITASHHHGRPDAKREEHVGDPSAPANVPQAVVETVSQLSMAMSTQRSSNSRELFRKIARFMLQAAEALDHAHQLGIVHRDIKPGNLLVDTRGQLWVTDFGLAHFHTDAELTQTGDIVGTLRYMSPEQASGQRVLLDHRTDVYSLGATMYELATLEPIFPGRNRQELLHQIIHDEPRAPRAIEKTVPVEMETIILKAVSKNPAERYLSAQELAADLQRYLDDKPILAKRPSLVERTRKWMRRHPSSVAAAVLLLVFGMIGFAASTVLIAREQWKTQQANDELLRANANAQAALTAEAKQRARAEADFAQARRSIEFFVQFSEGELAHNPAMQEVRRRLLETAFDYYEDFLTQHGDEPSIQAELSASRERVSQILAELGRLRGPTLMDIIRKPVVQDDLGLSEEQRKRVGEFLIVQQFEQVKQACDNAQFGNPKLFLKEPWAKAYDAANSVKMVSSVDKTFESILDQTQKLRFRQIALQVQQQGRLGFSDPTVKQDLNLTNPQWKKIRRVQNDAHKDWSDHLFSGRKIANPAAFWAGVQKNILGVLDKAQQDKWQFMCGKTINVDLRPGYPFDGQDMRLPHHHQKYGQPPFPFRPVPPGLPPFGRPGPELDPEFRGNPPKM